jgi:PAS domain S-box-containing protein
MNKEEEYAAELRKRAESRVVPAGLDELAALSPLDVAKLVHELRTHQIELEMQNTELLHIQDDLTEARDQYAELYNFAPAGYITIDRQGIILRANLTFELMVGSTQNLLINQPLSSLIVAEDQDIYYWHRRAIVENKTPQYCELRLKTSDGEPFWVGMDSVCAEGSTGACEQIQSVLRDITERKQAEDALQQSETHLHTLVDTIPDLIWMKDPAGVYLACNHRFERFYGATEVEILGKTDYDFVSKELADFFREKDLAAVAAGEARRNEEELTFADDGHCEQEETIKTPMYDRDGVLVGVLGVARDITERKQAAEAMEQLAKFPSENPNAVLRVDQAGTILYANDGSGFLLRSWNRSVGQMLPDDLLRTLSEVRAANRFRDEEIVCGDRVFILTIAPVAGKGYVNIYGRDITIRKRAEEERTRLMTAIDQMAEVIVITGTDAVIQYVNPAFGQVTGYSREEAIGQNPRVLKSGEQDAAFYKVLWDTLKKGETWRGRFTNKKKDGTLYVEEAVISPVRDASGRTVNYVAVKRDITAELSMEAQFRQSQKMEAVGQLVGGIAHDFNNLLQVINGFSEVTRLALDPASPAIGNLEEVIKAGKRAQMLVQQLLTFSRRQVINPVDLDLNEVVTEEMKMLRSALPEDIEFHFVAGKNLGTIHADRGQLGQVLMNLCVNARDAMLDGGVLTLETGTLPTGEGHLQSVPCVFLRVSDTGCGMDQQTQDHIFEPFFTTKEVGKGTGLGLSTVYGIVTQNKGYIHVESAVGKGTSFTIYLPVMVPEAAPVSGPAPSRPAGGTETILVAEDDESILNLTGITLRQAGYTVLTACNGEEAVQRFKENAGEIDLVLSDVVMPKLSGKEAMKQIHELKPAMPYLFVSGYSRHTQYTDFIEDRVLHFLSKPYESDVLLQKIRDLLDTK